MRKELWLILIFSSIIFGAGFASILNGDMVIGNWIGLFRLG